MNPIPFAKTTGAHFIAAWLVVSGVACDSPDAFNICNDRPECYSDGSADGPRRDTPLPPDVGLPDSAQPRNPLCGTTGCYPGNWNACGSVPLPDAAFYAMSAADDASDSSDDANADAAADATSDAVDAPRPPDAKGDTCDDGTHDAAVRDTSVDGAGPDAAEDAATDAEPDTSVDAPEDAEGGGPPTVDSSVPPPDGGRGDAATDTGTSDEPKIVQACYIRPAATTGVITECAPVGLGTEGSACNDSTDCYVLHACVEVDQRSACRAVSCGPTPDCLKGTYFQEAPLRAKGVTRHDLRIPVCLPADKCTLLAQPNLCPAGRVCTVVGSAGETTCLEPGTAKVGDFCDDTNRCAEGLLCSKFANQCVKICHIDTGSVDCPTGTCQGGNRSLPDGFGICVGQTDGG